MIIYPGRRAYYLKATIGLPLSVMLLQCERFGAMIDWPGFVAAARLDGWPDFKTYEHIVEALNDSGVFPDLRSGILQRLRTFIIANP